MGSLSLNGNLLKTTENSRKADLYAIQAKVNQWSYA